MTRPIS